MDRQVHSVMSFMLLLLFYFVICSQVFFLHNIFNVKQKAETKTK